MTILDESTLARYRVAGPCDVCCRWFAVRQAHHIEPRRMGAGSRLDCSWNLLAVDGFCHRLIEDGKPIQRGPRAGAALRQADQWLIVTHRDMLPLDADLQKLVWWFARLDKAASPARVAVALGELNEAERGMAAVVLERRERLLRAS